MYVQQVEIKDTLPEDQEPQEQLLVVLVHQVVDRELQDLALVGLDHNKTFTNQEHKVDRVVFKEESEVDKGQVHSKEGSLEDKDQVLSKEEFREVKAQAPLPEVLVEDKDQALFKVVFPEVRVLVRFKEEYLEVKDQAHLLEELVEDKDQAPSKVESPEVKDQVVFRELQLEVKDLVVFQELQLEVRAQVVFQEDRVQALLEDKEEVQVMMVVTMMVIILQFPANLVLTILFIQKYLKLLSVVKISNTQDTTQMLKLDVKYSIFALTIWLTISFALTEQYFTKNISFVFGGTNSSVKRHQACTHWTRSSMIIQLLEVKVLDLKDQQLVSQDNKDQPDHLQLSPACKAQQAPLHLSPASKDLKDHQLLSPDYKDQQVSR